MNFTSRNTSLSQILENIALKLKALQLYHLVSNSNPDDFINMHDEKDIDNILQKLNDDKSIETVDFDAWSHRSIENW